MLKIWPKRIKYEVFNVLASKRYVLRDGSEYKVDGG